MKWCLFIVNTTIRKTSQVADQVATDKSPIYPLSRPIHTNQRLWGIYTLFLCQLSLIDVLFSH